jgi:type IV pilus assembly protein PilW
MAYASFARRDAGFTLVEVMVGLLIGLIATVVMFQVFAVSEGQKRTTTGAGDAQQNGVASLFQVERDARMAGYGINFLPLLGCQINGWFEGTSTPFTLVLAPLVITDGVGGTPDSITFMYGDSDLFMAPAKLTQTMPSPAAVYKVDNRFGFAEGNIVIGAEAGKPCTMGQVSTLPGTPGSTDNVIHNSGTYTDPNGNQTPTQYNKPGGLGTTYSAWNPATNTGGRVYNLGALPTVVTYAVQNSELTATNQLAPGAVGAISTLSEGIVQMQAQYAYDGTGDGGVPSNAPSRAVITLGNTDQWGDAMPAGATGADWAKVIAVRLAIVARSMQPEKPNPTTNVCDATTAAPLWQSKGVAIDVSATPNWQCYRYRLFEVTVPLRNMVWFALPS